MTKTFETLWLLLPSGWQCMKGQKDYWQNKSQARGGERRLAVFRSYRSKEAPKEKKKENEDGFLVYEKTICIKLF